MYGAREYPAQTSSVSAAALGFAGLANAFFALLWFVSVSLDKEPFESESEIIGFMLGMGAFLCAVMLAALAFTDGGQPLSLGVLAVLKTFYTMGMWALLFHKFVHKDKKLSKNWGYAFIGFTSTMTSFGVMMYVAVALVGFHAIHEAECAGHRREQELGRMTGYPQQATQPFQESYTYQQTMSGGPVGFQPDPRYGQHLSGVSHNVYSGTVMTQQEKHLRYEARNDHYGGHGGFAVNPAMPQRMRPM
eukprot:TRINITY_DN12303_c0_g2_i1.p1 TRINITY_DN12303_c0_g2~~TRINITY_DN12303_c0_g2_i1.p1  ORF type:complete len:247 (-),score=42.66 TRINITY_DN12303_c0_g2_i1:119-859(-)